MHTAGNQSCSTLASRVRRREGDLAKLLAAQYEVCYLGNDWSREFWVRMNGPADSPYEEGVWLLHFTVPPEYPFKSPSVGFHNKVLHPNVDEPSGSICLDVLNTTWTPLFDFLHVVETFLPQLLRYPNPADPFNAEAAALFDTDPAAYDKAVRAHVRIHGQATRATISEAVLMKPAAPASRSPPAAVLVTAVVLEDEPDGDTLEDLEI